MGARSRDRTIPADASPPPPVPARTQCPSRGTSLRRWRGTREPPRAHRGFRSCYLLEEAPSIGKTRGQRVRVSQSRNGRPWLELPLSAECESALQRTDRVVEVALREGHATECGESFHEGERMVCSF